MESCCQTYPTPTPSSQIRLCPAPIYRCAAFLGQHVYRTQLHHCLYAHRGTEHCLGSLLIDNWSSTFQYPDPNCWSAPQFCGGSNSWSTFYRIAHLEGRWPRIWRSLELLMLFSSSQQRFYCCCFSIVLSWWTCWCHRPCQPRKPPYQPGTSLAIFWARSF